MSKNQIIFSAEKEISLLKKKLKEIDKVSIILNKGFKKTPTVVSAKDGLEYHFNIYSISADKEVAIQEKTFVNIDTDIIQKNFDCVKYKTDIKTMTNIRKYLSDNKMTENQLFKSPLTSIEDGVKVRSTKTAMENIIYKHIDGLDTISNILEKVVYIKQSISSLEKDLKNLGGADISESDFPFYFSEFDKKITADFTGLSTDGLNVKDGEKLKEIFIERVVDQRATLTALQEKGVDCSYVVSSTYAVLAAGTHDEVIAKTKHMANGYERNVKQTETFMKMILDIKELEFLPNVEIS